MKIKDVVLSVFFTFLLQSTFSQTFSIDDAGAMDADVVRCNGFLFSTYLGCSISNLTNQPIELRVRSLDWYIPSEWNASCSAHIDNTSIPNCFNGMNRIINILGNGETFVEWHLMFPFSEYPTDTASVQIEVSDENDPSNLRDTFVLKFILVNPAENLPLFEFSHHFSHQKRIFDPHTLFYEQNSLFLHINFVNSRDLKWRKIREVIPFEWDDVVVSNSYFRNSGSQNEGVVHQDCDLAPLIIEEILRLNAVGTQPATMERSFVLYDPADSVGTAQTITYLTTLCPEKSQQDVIQYDGSTTLCQGEEIQLYTPPGYSHFQWDDGQTSETIMREAGETVTLICRDSNGCKIVDTLMLDIRRPYEEEICAVTTDPATGQNLVVWEKTTGVGTEYFNIYKESVMTGAYDSIGSVPFAQQSVFLDEDSNPLIGSYHYRITAVDDCGNESDLSKVHKTIHLASNLGVNGEVNLIWSNYEGVDFSTFNILRGTDPSQLTLLAQRPSNTFSYTDLNPPSGSVYYRLEIQLQNPCTPSARSTDFLSIYSNDSRNNIVGVLEPEITDKITIAPNPANDIILVKNGSDLSFDLKLLSLEGKILAEKRLEKNSTSELQLLNYPVGTYNLNLASDKGMLNKRIIIQR